MSRFLCRLAGHRWTPGVHLFGRTLHVQCRRCGTRTVAPLDHLRGIR